MARQTLEGFYDALSTELTRDNAIFARGESITEIDTGQRKIGDGKTPYNDLPYEGNGSGGLTQAEIEALIDADIEFDNLTDFQDWQPNTLYQAKKPFYYINGNGETTLGYYGVQITSGADAATDPNIIPISDGTHQTIEMTSDVMAQDNTTYTNNSATPRTLEIPPGLKKGAFAQQATAAGVITVTAGTGVTFVPSGSQQTIDAGDVLSIMPTSIANTYLVFRGGNLTIADVENLATELASKAQKFNAPVTDFTSRVLADSDHNKTIVPTDNAQTVTLNIGLTSGFYAFVNNNATVDGTATINDKRETGATNPAFAIINVEVDEYDLIGSKA